MRKWRYAYVLGRRKLVYYWGYRAYFLYFVYAETGFFAAHGGKGMYGKSANLRGKYDFGIFGFLCFSGTESGYLILHGNIGDPWIVCFVWSCLAVKMSRAVYAFFRIKCHKEGRALLG